MTDEPLVVRRDPRPFGRSALRVFPLAYGCWRWKRGDLRRARDCVLAAVEGGIELFDLADVYGGDGAVEELFGKVLREIPDLRPRIYIATKGGMVPGERFDTSPGYLARAVEGSLRRLQCERIDLYLLHRHDFLTHPEETARALERLCTEGKVCAVGVSNHTPAQFDTLQRFLARPLAVHQREWSCVWPAPLEDGTLEQCLLQQVGFLAWGPLAGGKLLLSDADIARQREADRLRAVIAVLDRIAEEQQVVRAAAALAFLMVHPAQAVPIIGTTRPERIREISRDVFRTQLSRAAWYAILQAGMRRKLV